MIVTKTSTLANEADVPYSMNVFSEPMENAAATAPIS
jgi:hypothetical protein